ncbi:unnamed protein product, partial [Fusarium fujikuroi]
LPPSIIFILPSPSPPSDHSALSAFTPFISYFARKTLATTNCPISTQSCRLTDHKASPNLVFANPHAETNTAGRRDQATDIQLLIWYCHGWHCAPWRQQAFPLGRDWANVALHTPITGRTAPSAVNKSPVESRLKSWPLQSHHDNLKASRSRRWVSKTYVKSQFCFSVV